MKICVLNNSLSPAFVIKTEDENILVNTPKGFYYSLDDEIDSVLFTSDDLYHTYDIEQLKYISKKMLICYAFKEFIPNLKKLITTYDLPLTLKEVKPYIEIKKGITTLFLHKKPIGIYSNISMGLKLNNTVILPLFKSITDKTKQLLDNTDLILLTLKYLETDEKNNSSSVDEMINLLNDINVKELCFLGLGAELKHTFDREYLKVGNKLKID